MNKLIYIGLLAACLISCSDFLDIEDETKISNDEIFTTLEGASEAINGVYYQLSANDFYGENMLVLPDIKGGNLKINDLSFEAASSFNFIPSFEFSHTVEGDDDKAEGIYEELYVFINSVNNVVSNVDRIEDASENEKAQILAEAKALRALAHFDLTRFYAQPYSYTANAQHLGIPYLKTNVSFDEKTQRDLLFNNYEDMISDLKDAEENLGTPIASEGALYNRAYMTKLAAQALLARVYLYKNDWDKAREYATKVIEDGGVSLVSNSEVLAYYSNNTPTSEDIFIIDKSGRNNGAVLSSTMGLTEDRTRIYLTVSNDIQDLYEDGDVRKQLFGQQLEKIISTKHIEFPGAKDHYDSVIRLAEMYLIRAEASLNLPVSNEVQARADLDVIRKRANPAAANLQLSGAALKEELFQERRRELAFEGHLFFDIARMGRDLRRVDCNALQNVNIDYPSNLFVLPIPEYAILNNYQMEQNPGY